MIYPDYVPDSIVDLHREVAKNIASADPDVDISMARATEKVVKSIIAYPKMRGSWKVLHGAWKKSSSAKSFDEEMRDVVFEAIAAAEGPSPDWGALSKSERFEKVSSLVTKIRQLANETTETLDESVVRLIPHNCVKNKFSNILKENYYQEAQQSNAADWKSLAGEMSFRSGFSPRISDVLREWARQMEERLNETGPVILPRPGAGRSDVIYFIRRFGPELQYQFGEPLYGVIENFAYAVYKDSSIDRDYVKKVLKPLRDG